MIPIAMAPPFSHMLEIPFFSVLSTLILRLFMLLANWPRKTKASTRKLPPGPPKLPWIGNLHQFMMPGKVLPHRSMAELARKYGPVMHLQLGENSTFVISSAEMAEEVLKTNELCFAQRPALIAESFDYSGIIFAPYGDYWRQLQRIALLELLSMKRVASFRDVREEEAWNLVESISSSEGFPVNIGEKILALTNDVAARAAFGKKCKDQGEFIAVLGGIVQFDAALTVAYLYPSLIRFLACIPGFQLVVRLVRKKLDMIFDNIINEHKVKRKSNKLSSSNLQEDFVDVLLKFQEPNELDMNLTNDQIKSVTADIFSAGSETSAITMEWVMSELTRNPRAMEKVQVEVRQAFKGKTKIRETDVKNANLDYLKCVIKETMRMHPPITLMHRECREQCEIGGYEIPVRANAVINSWAIGRDPDVWEEPDCFKPERFLDSSIDYKGRHYEFIPFGAGRRICPALSFAAANMELALAQMLYHFDWKLPNGMKPEELDMTENFGITIRKKQKLQLIPTTHVPFA